MRATIAHMDGHETDQSNKLLFLISDKAWVRKYMHFETIALTLEDVMSGGPTCSNPAVEKAVVEHYKEIQNVDAGSVLNLGNILWGRLSPDHQKFFSDKVHPGQDFPHWLKDRVPLQGTRFADGSGCQYVASDLKNTPLVMRNDSGMYRLNPEIVQALHPAIHMHIDEEPGNDRGVVTFELLHGTN